MSETIQTRVPEGAAHLVWAGSRHATTAFVVASFPLLFLLDIPIDGLSPVLPGLGVLMVSMLLMPYALSEVAFHRLRRREDFFGRAHRRARRARHVRTLAWVWFVLWFLLGV